MVVTVDAGLERGQEGIAAGEVEIHRGEREEAEGVSDPVSTDAGEAGGGRSGRRRHERGRENLSCRLCAYLFFVSPSRRS